MLNRPEKFNALDLETFNARVYSELFLTPASDPWLGMSSVETYLALSGVEPRRPPQTGP